jgi:hypothetical protein
VSAWTEGDTVTVQVRRGENVLQMVIERARLRGATRDHAFDFTDFPVELQAGDAIYVAWAGTSNTLTVEITVGLLLPQPTTA